ncbi:MULTISPECIES: dicarboxylate/amino acid:cation symporter [unclassified Corynebacterium]|uniref:dicarboxylate/amino acid:cation symporter n=1 Tax=unclassified Corynebacterium TaxID=2624378 RepID=UPI001C48774F|nr:MULTISPECIES: dicarboxylate/amino acid:cation symporter [unclassified Corynebacterium]MBV7282357.1 dicarboxylate/amino acid:cation symporter [Corynebacterium sp. TAE3-ERU30]MBV7302296.1 dicarboxylate/amino acid:cation symporter [Corynebacterium sp. TAE3-ERU2]
MNTGQATMAAPEKKKGGFLGSLLMWIIVAIVLGSALSLVLPDWLARIFVTFNGLFGNFLGFFIPILIFALIAPAIAGIGRGAGKWLLVTTAIAYASTVLSGFAAYGLSRGLYPSLLSSEALGDAVDIDAGALTPYFEVEMPPLMNIMTALLLAFIFGIGMTVVKADTAYTLAKEVEEIVQLTIRKFVIPLLPIFIFGMFLSMGKNGNMQKTMTMFAVVLILAIVATLVLLLVQFLIAGAIAGRNPLRAWKTMLPAYFTALGTSSSAATIPVTYSCAQKNGVSANVAGFVVPLCATIHLSGSMMKISLFAFAIMFMAGTPVSPALAFGFVLMLGITMIAAPGVPGGAIMAASTLLSSMLGFTDDQVALMIAAYIAIDSFGTACNVTGDGAIAMIVNKLSGGRGAEKKTELEDA